MKKSVVEILIFAALGMFGVIILMTITGAVACLLGAGDAFYCGAFCTTGKIFLGLAGLVIIVHAVLKLRTKYQSV